MKRPKKKRRPLAVVPKRAFESGATSRLTSSWLLSGMSADAEIRTHLFTLRDRCRDLERNNDYARGFGEDIEANVLGSEGVILQMKVTEEADRVITSPEEKSFIEEYQARTNARRQRIRTILERRGGSKKYLQRVFPDVKLLHRNGPRAMKVLKGQPDVFANELIERAYKEAGKKENFTVTRELTRQECERMWLRSTWRDGALLIRWAKGFENDFKFALQFIDIDWLDLNYSCVLENGNEVRMGKEYNKWKECIAYHLLVRSPGDWQWSVGGIGGRFNRQRIAAEEIQHGYIRERVDQSREIPWMVSAITRMQMLAKYEEAELVASLLAARKTGTWYSDIFSDNATLTKDFSVTEKGEFEEATEPGQDTIAPYGWKYQVNDPKHPTTTVEQFRRVMLQGISSGLPGASYHRISQDPSGLSFSNLRGIELQSRESWMMIQSFMRDNFHIPHFNRFLEAGLMSGQIPLPISKIDKFNKPYFIFRRWKGIDPIKEAEGNKLNLLLGNTTRTRIAAETGADFEEIVEQLIVEEEIIAVSGLGALSLSAIAGGGKQSEVPTVGKEDGAEDPAAGKEDGDDEEGNDDPEQTTTGDE